MPFKSNRHVRQRLSLEQLESRVCLSADPVFSEGVLSIGGSQDSDMILISDNSRGVVFVRDGGSGREWEFTGVERIVVDTGEGDDTIRYTSFGGGDSPIPELDIRAGGGDDEVAIGLLLPAVQKVRDAAARAKVDLGEGNDLYRMRTTGVDLLELDLAAGGGDDEVLIGMLLPAVQKVREAAARTKFDLGEGNDLLRMNTTGIDLLDLDLAAGGGDDEILIGMLLPAVQKVRESAARTKFDLGDGNDLLRMRTTGADLLELDLAAGGGDDEVLIGMLLPAVQKVRAAAARLNVELGDGNDFVRAQLNGIDAVDAVFDAGTGDDDLAIGLLLPAVQKVRENPSTELKIVARLGEGSDIARVSSHGYSRVESDIDTGPAGDGIDSIAAVHVSPLARAARILRRFVTPMDDDQDLSRLLAVGYESVDVTTEQTRQITIIQDI